MMRPVAAAAQKPEVRCMMVRELVHDPIFLGMKSEMATREDLPAAQDLMDTLQAHRDSCVGMAGNMIGVLRRIIVFDNEGSCMLMLNPEIIKKSGLYETEEGCQAEACATVSGISLGP